MGRLTSSLVPYSSLHSLGLSRQQGGRVGRRGLLRLCVTKLARIEDPETKLCKAVLINNTLRKIQRDTVSEYPEEMEEMGEECEEEVEEEEEETEAPSEERDNEGDERLESEAAVTSLALYKDVINDFLGVIDFPKFSETDKLETEVRPDFWDSVREAQEDKENRVEEEEDRVEAGYKREEVEEAGYRSEEVSQYSYGSFLSEVYRVTMDRIKHRVKI